MIKIAAALFVLVLAALPAHAEVKAATVFNGCNTEQRAALRSALENVDRDVGTVLDRIRQGTIDDYWRTWYGTGDRSRVTHILTLIQDRLKNPGTLILACAERDCDNNMMGYAETGLISVCPDFFRSPPRDAYDSQMGTLVHELSHALAHTEDHGYGPSDARRLAAQDPAKAVENADNVEYFTEAVSGSTIRHGTTAFRPGDSCQWAMDGECDHPGLGTGVCEAGTDTTDCQDASAQSARSGATRSGARRPTVGPANSRDLCATALNGLCDEPERGGSNACSLGTDYTDCLTGHRSKAAH